jgi:hypothetical protein
MENLAKPWLGFFRHAGMKKFLLALLTIAALSGAVLVTHSSPAAALFQCVYLYPWCVH